MKMPQCQDALSKSILDTKVAVAGYIGAGVFAATWLILQLTEPSPATPSAERALATPICAPLAGAGMGLACALRF